MLQSKLIDEYHLGPVWENYTCHLWRIIILNNNNLEQTPTFKQLLFSQETNDIWYPGRPGNVLLDTTFSLLPIIKELNGSKLLCSWFSQIWSHLTFMPSPPNVREIISLVENLKKKFTKICEILNFERYYFLWIKAAKKYYTIYDIYYK